MPFEPILADDVKAEPSEGTRSLALDDTGARSARGSGPTAHGGVMPYVGSLSVFDAQASGVPATALNMRAVPVVGAIGLLHPQHSDTFIRQSYGYGQPGSHNSGLYYPNVTVSGGNTYQMFSQYLFCTPAANPSVFGSSVTPDAHRMSDGPGGYATHNFVRPGPPRGAALYYYTSAQGTIYSSPQMPYGPMACAVGSTMQSAACSNQDLRVSLVNLAARNGPVIPSFISSRHTISILGCRAQ